MQVSFDDVRETTRSGSNNFPFFKLQNHEIGYVRFVHTHEDYPELYNVHNVEYYIESNGQNKRIFNSVDCLRTVGGPVDACPFCNSGDQKLMKISQIGLIKVLQYTHDNTGRMVATPCVWQRTASWIKQNLINYINLYQGTMPEKLFMVQRNGEGLDTKYTVTPLVGLPQFSDADYPLPATNPFDGYVLKNNLTCKSAEDMMAFIATKQFPWHNENTVTNADGQSNATAFAQPTAFTPQNMAIQPNEIPFEQAQPIPPQMVQPMPTVQPMPQQNVAFQNNVTAVPTAQPTVNPMQSTPWANQTSTMPPVQRRY